LTTIYSGLRMKSKSKIR